MSIVKQILRCVLVLSVIVGGVVAQRTANHTARFNPSGEYHPFNQPSEARFLQFHLQVRHKRGRLVAWGELVDVQFYRFRYVSVTEKHLQFLTERHHGISYKFEGLFLRGGNFTIESDIAGSFPLQGRLLKFVNGKKVIELTTPFVYYVGC
jgi:hypothetical protein